MWGCGSVQRPAGFLQQQQFPLCVCQRVLTAGLFSPGQAGWGQADGVQGGLSASRSTWGIITPKLG